MERFKSRKLKVDKKFSPVSSEVGEEYCQNGLFKFNITKLLNHIKKNPDKFQPEEILVKSVRIYSLKNLDKSTIQAANLNEPIVLAEIAPGQFNVIDGNHRLEKAHNDGVSTILAYKVIAEQHIAFLTSVEAYKSYVEYWNSKLKEYQVIEKFKIKIERAHG